MNTHNLYNWRFQKESTHFPFLVKWQKSMNCGGFKEFYQWNRKGKWLLPWMRLIVVYQIITLKRSRLTGSGWGNYFRCPRLKSLQDPCASVWQKALPNQCAVLQVRISLKLPPIVDESMVKGGWQGRRSWLMAGLWPPIFLLSQIQNHCKCRK